MKPHNPYLAKPQSYCDVIVNPVLQCHKTSIMNPVCAYSALITASERGTSWLNGVYKMLIPLALGVTAIFRFTALLYI